MIDNWKDIPEDLIRLKFKETCECHDKDDREAFVIPSSINEVGSPICGECGQDMDFLGVSLNVVGLSELVTKKLEE